MGICCLLEYVDEMNGMVGERRGGQWTLGPEVAHVHIVLQVVFEFFHHLQHKGDTFSS